MAIEIDSAVQTLYNDMRLENTHKWATLKFEGRKKIIVEKASDPCLTETREDDKVQFDEMKEYLMAIKEPRYVLYNFRFTSTKGILLIKITLINYCLDQFSAVDRILYTSNMDTLTKSFSDLCAVFQPKDLADVDYDAWATDIEKKP